MGGGVSKKALKNDSSNPKRLFNFPEIRSIVQSGTFDDFNQAIQHCEEFSKEQWNFLLSSSYNKGNDEIFNLILNEKIQEITPKTLQYFIDRNDWDTIKRVGKKINSVMDIVHTGFDRVRSIFDLEQVIKVAKEVWQDKKSIASSEVEILNEEPPKLSIINPSLLSSNEEVDYNKPDRNGWTLLHKAAARGMPNIVVYLIEEHGVDLDARMETAMSPRLLREIDFSNCTAFEVSARLFDKHKNDNDDFYAIMRMDKFRNFIDKFDGNESEETKEELLECLTEFYDPEDRSGERMEAKYQTLAGRYLEVAQIIFAARYDKESFNSPHSPKKEYQEDTNFNEERLGFEEEVSQETHEFDEILNFEEVSQKAPENIFELSSNSAKALAAATTKQSSNDVKC